MPSSSHVESATLPGVRRSLIHRTVTTMEWITCNKNIWYLFGWEIISTICSDGQLCGVANPLVKSLVQPPSNQIIFHSDPVRHADIHLPFISCPFIRDHFWRRRMFTRLVRSSDWCDRSNAHHLYLHFRLILWNHVNFKLPLLPRTKIWIAKCSVHPKKSPQTHSTNGWELSQLHFSFSRKLISWARACVGLLHRLRYPSNAPCNWYRFDSWFDDNFIFYLHENGK